MQSMADGMSRGFLSGTLFNWYYVDGSRITIPPLVYVPLKLVNQFAGQLAERPIVGRFRLGDHVGAEAGQPDFEMSRYEFLEQPEGVLSLLGQICRAFG